MKKGWRGCWAHVIKRGITTTVFVFCIWTTVSAQIDLGLIDKADSLLRSGDYEGYLHIGVLLTESENPLIKGGGFQMMAQAYGYLKKDSLALVTFHKAERLLKNDSYLLGAKAQFFLERYELDSALNNSVKALESLRAYDDSLHISDLLFDTGFALKLQEQYKEAEQVLLQSLEFDTTNWSIYHQLGHVYLYTKEYQKSLAYCDAARAKGGKNSDLEYVRATALYLTGDVKRGIEIADSIRSDTSMTFVATLLLGEIYQSVDSAEVAIDYYKKGLELEPENIASLNNIAFINMYRGRYEEAMEYFDKCISIDPDFAFAYNNKALCLYNLGLHQEALRNCDKSLQLDPENAWAYANRTKIYFALSMSSMGCRDIEKAESLEYPEAEELEELKKKCGN
ncbi:MAG: hypothetical protein Roseis2KO_28640 [Roseivirga sp.]